jgi:hypothetical protein
MMRKIEMMPIAGDAPALVEIVEGRRYLAVLTMHPGATETARLRALETLKATLPRSVAALVLPHGHRFDVYEDDETEKNAATRSTT